MENFFSYKKVVGEKSLTAGVRLDYIVNYIFDEDTLYLFLNEQIEAVRLVNIPVEGKKTKENPSGWGVKEQARTVKESYTLEISEKEDIERFLSYVATKSI
jgi:hypothetical protein